MNRHQREQRNSRVGDAVATIITVALFGVVLAVIIAVAVKVVGWIAAL